MKKKGERPALEIMFPGRREIEHLFLYPQQRGAIQNRGPPCLSVLLKIKRGRKKRASAA